MSRRWVAMAIAAVIGVLAGSAALLAFDPLGSRAAGPCAELRTYLPVVLGAEPAPLPTPFAIAEVTQRARMEYGILVDEPHLWMPVPRYWDGSGTREIAIVAISPPPTSRYRERNGTEIVYWERLSYEEQALRIVFDVELGSIRYDLDGSEEWGAYDTTSALYLRNTCDTESTQVSHPEIQAKASEIVGDEPNPYEKARLIHRWVASSITFDGTWYPQDALTALRERHGDCASRANLFVALARAADVPARNVAGINDPHRPELGSGSWLDGTLYTHVWAEFYLPEYGWIQVDPGADDSFGRISEPRLITSKGNDIELGNGNPCGVISWFHIPYAVCQNEHVPLWLVVEDIP